MRAQKNRRRRERSGGGTLPLRRSSSTQRGAPAPAPTTTTTPSAALVAIATALVAAASGFELCASKTRDASIAVAARRESESLRSAARSIDAPARRPHMGDRLRWEWLASTGIVMDGRCEVRLLSECARHLESITVTRELSRDVEARLRVAKLTASSLVLAIDDQRMLGYELAPI